MKNGGFVRGTILESIPNDHVEIQLPSGETRRFAWDEVTYAGPDDRKAPEPPAAPPPKPRLPAVEEADDTVPLHFEGEGAEELRLHLRVGESDFVGSGWGGRGPVVVSGRSRSYSSLCVAPCGTRMMRGTHRLALSTRGGKPIEAPDGVRIDGPSIVRGRYESYSGTRAAGWLTLAGADLAGLIIMFTSFKSKRDCSVGVGYCFDSPYVDGTQLAIGVGVMIVGSLVGLALGLKRDEVSFTVSPLSVGAPRFEGKPVGAAGSADGLALTARF